MKNLLGLMVMVAVVVSCSLGKKDGATKTPATTPESQSASSLTLEKFNQLQDGMKYQDAVRILGSEGTETSSFSSGGTKTITYKWEGEKYARVTVTFKNDALTSKIQMNVKSGGGTANAPAADVTLAKYNEMQTGMGYEEVVKIIGSNGIQVSSSTSEDYYKWEGPNGRIYATFRDKKLSAKSHGNLK